MRILVRAVSVLVLGFLLAPGSFADGSAKPASRAKKSKASHSAIAASATSTAAPAAPAAEPLPAPAVKKSRSTVSGTPKVEIFGGYSYVRARTRSKVKVQVVPTIAGGPRQQPPPAAGTIVSEDFDLHGGIGSIGYNLNDWFGIEGEFAGYKVAGLPSGVSANLLTYLFGPKIAYRKNDRLTPYGHVLFGGARLSGSSSSSSSTFFGSGSTSENVFAMAAGGGVDVKVAEHIALRLIEADYLLTKFSDNSNDRQNNIRIATGIVFRLGGGPPPPPPNRPPVASCSADKSSVFADSGDIVAVRAQASDPDNDPLTYSWSASGGKVEGTGSEVRWNSAGLAPGSYTVTARVDDGRGGTASCSADIRVEPRPNRPPTMSCSVDRSSVLIGERVHVTAVANDPDGDPLTYSWNTNGGQVVGSGASVDLDTTGVAAGHYTVTGRVEDGRGGAADCSAGVDVQAPPPPPQASKLNECFFKQPGSARVDNVCKRILDDVALRLQSEPKSSLGVVGYVDPKEARSQKLAQKRGDSAAKYLSEKGVATSRITVRAAGGQTGAGKQNRRIDLIYVPEGATF